MFISAGVVKDENTKEPVPNLSIKFIAEGEEEEMASDVTKETGKYLVNILSDRSYSVIIEDKNGQTLGTFEYLVPILKEKDPLDYIFDIELNAVAPELISSNMKSAVPEDEEIVAIEVDEEEEDTEEVVDEFKEEEDITGETSSSQTQTTKFLLRVLSPIKQTQPK